MGPLFQRDGPDDLGRARVEPVHHRRHVLAPPSGRRRVRPRACPRTPRSASRPRCRACGRRRHLVPGDGVKPGLDRMILPPCMAFGVDRQQDLLHDVFVLVGRQRPASGTHDAAQDRGDLGQEPGIGAAGLLRDPPASARPNRPLCDPVGLASHPALRVFVPDVTPARPEYFRQPASAQLTVMGVTCRPPIAKGRIEDPMASTTPMEEIS